MDTVRGQVDFRDWAVNPREISFLDGLSGKKLAYGPGDLSSFQVEGETYSSFTVKIYPYSMDAAVLSGVHFDASPYDSTVFLRLLIGGKLSLYFYEDRNDLTCYFLQRQGEIPQQLRISTRLVQEEDATAKMEVINIYRDQLTDWLGDCPGEAGRTARVAYAEKDLRRLVFAYNNCGKDIAEQKETAKDRHGKFSLTPMLGYFSSSVRINGGLDLARMSWPSYSGITGGLGLLMVIPRGRDQFSFFTDLLFQHFHSASGAYVINTIQNERWVLDYSELQFNVLFRYRYPARNLRPFAEVGVSNGFIFNNKSTELLHINSSNQDIPEPIFGGTGTSNMASYLPGLIGGIGIMVSRFSLEARIEKTASLTPVESLNAPVTSFSVLAGFNF
jgi:hypothetical protein